MRIAVVIPTFDRPACLREALESVAAQTRPPDEVHVVIDAGPRQEAIESEFADRLPMQWHRLDENGGQAAARNVALARADADAFALLDDDDLFLDRHLERLERGLRQNPPVSLVYDDAEIWRTRTGERPEDPDSRRTIALDYDPARMRRWDYVPPCSWLVRADPVRRAGGFDAALRCYEDWDLLLRLEAWGGARRIPGPGSVVRIRDENQSLRFDAWRSEMLARFQAKHDLHDIAPMTFWEVAAAVHPAPS